MPMYTAKELTYLSRAYMNATGVKASTLGITIADHNRLIERLFEGYEILSRTCETASVWFDENWPDDLEWPANVPQLHQAAPKEPAYEMADGE